MNHVRYRSIHLCASQQNGLLAAKDVGRRLRVEASDGVVPAHTSACAPGQAAGAQNGRQKGHRAGADVLRAQRSVVGGEDKKDAALRYKLCVVTLNAAVGGSGRTRGAGVSRCRAVSGNALLHAVTKCMYALVIHITTPCVRPQVTG